MGAFRLYGAVAFGVGLAILGGCGGSTRGPVAIDAATEVLVADLDGDGRLDVIGLTYQFGD